MAPLKILVLHQMNSCAAECQEGMQPIVEACKGVVEFTFLESPNVLDEQKPEVRSWGLFGPGTRNADKSWCNDYWSKTEHAVRDAWDRVKGFDGIWGESQGGVAAAILTSLFLRPEILAKPIHSGLHNASIPLKPFKLCIVSVALPAGHKMLNLDWVRELGFPKLEGETGFNVFGEEKTMTMFVMGKNDEQLPEQVARMTIHDGDESKRVEWHEGGHHVPVDGEWPNFFKAYFLSFMEENGDRGGPSVVSPSTGSTS